MRFLTLFRADSSSIGDPYRNFGLSVPHTTNSTTLALTCATDTILEWLKKKEINVNFRVV